LFYFVEGNKEEDSTFMRRRLIIWSLFFLLPVLSGCTQFRAQLFDLYTDANGKPGGLESDAKTYQQSYECRISRACPGKLPDIIAELSSGRITTRIGGVSEIGCHGTSAGAALSALLLLLHDHSAKVRRWAIFAIWQIGSVKSAEAELVSMLEDSNDGVRAAAAAVLLETGTPASRTAAQKLVSWSPIELVRGPVSLFLAPVVFAADISYVASMGFATPEATQELSSSGSQPPSAGADIVAGILWLPVGICGGTLAGAIDGITSVVTGCIDTVTGGAMALSPGLYLPSFGGGEASARFPLGPGQTTFVEPERFTRFALPRCEVTNLNP
jgi:hypothetical protein